MRAELAWLPLLALLLAGCLGAPSGPGPGPEAPPVFAPDWAAKALPQAQDHDHGDPAQHQDLSTPNFQVLGWDPLPSAYKGNATPGGHFCGDSATSPEGRRLAVVHSFTTDVAFVLVDVTDPARPAKVGEYILERTHVYDVAMTPDGLHVALGTDPTDTGPDGGPLPLGDEARGVRVVQPRFRDACTGEVRAAGPEQPLPLASGVALVGIADPANPVLEDFRPLPLLGAHSISTAAVDGRTYVVGSVTNGAHLASYFHFLEVQPTPLGPRLVLLSTYQAPPPAPQALPVLNLHVDASIQKHPLTGATLAYLANWDGGVVVLDISDPRVPRQIGQWTDLEGTFLLNQDGGAIHETLPIEGLWEGRHYVIAGQELSGRPQNRPTGWVHVLDTTDPANPVAAGRWTLPVDIPSWSNLQFSTHYVDLVGRTMFVAMYHGGVWAVDLGPANLAEPTTVGVFIPARAAPSPPPSGQLAWAPTVLQALAQPDGTLVVFDGPSGVYTVRFDAAHPAPAPAPWKV